MIAMALFWFAPLCVHDQITFVRSVGGGVCGGRGSNFLWMKSHSRQRGGWWQRASFPPYDENHVSGKTRAEKHMVSGNTSGAAPSPSLYLFHSLLPSISPFLLSPLSPLFLLCILPIWAAKNRSQGLWAGFVLVSRWACHNRIEYFRGPWHSEGPPLLPSSLCLDKGASRPRLRRPQSTYSWDAGWSNYLERGSCARVQNPQNSQIRLQTHQLSSVNPHFSRLNP